jgi:hypothetical protein
MSIIPISMPATMLATKRAITTPLMSSSKCRTPAFANDYRERADLCAEFGSMGLDLL